MPFWSNMNEKVCRANWGSKKSRKIKRGSVRLNLGASILGVRGGPGPLGSPGSARDGAPLLEGRLSLLRGILDPPLNTNCLHWNLFLNRLSCAMFDFLTHTMSYSIARLQQAGSISRIRVHRKHCQWSQKQCTSNGEQITWFQFTVKLPE